MMEPKLTIVIPTYNRAQMLKKNVDIILRQIRNKPVELIVCDNASTDDTEQLMLQECERGNIVYYRNKTNCGPDNNFLLGYKRARGEYVLLLGDDDLLLPGAVDSILDSLAGNPVIVHLNTCTLLNEHKSKWGQPRFADEGIITYSNKNTFLRKVDIFITFLSSMVLKTKYVNEIPNKETYVGTYFLQSYIALDTLKNDGEYVIDTYNCIAASPNRRVSYDLYHVWGRQYRRLIINKSVECGISKEEAKEMYYDNMNNIIYDFVLSFRLTCKQSKYWKKEEILEGLIENEILYNKYKRALTLPKLLLAIEKAYRICKRNLK